MKQLRHIKGVEYVLSIKNVLTAILCCALCQIAEAATITNATSGAWNVGTTWVGGVVPALTDDVVIVTNTTVTITSAKLNPSGVITIQAGGTLSDGGNTITINNNLNPGMIIRGTYIVEGALNKGKGGRNPTVLVSSAGVLNFTTTGSGTAITSWDLQTGSTISYSANGDQTIANTMTTYANLTLAGSGTKTLDINSTVNGTLSRQGTATFALGGNTLTYGPAAVLEYKGSAIQTAATTEFPTPMSAAVVIDNASGVTISATARTLNNNLTLTQGTLTLGAGLTLGNGVTVTRVAGSLSAAPTFGTTVNLVYTGATGVTAGSEMPTNTTVLNNLTLHYISSEALTLNRTPTVNGVLTLTSGLIFTQTNQVNLASGASVVRTDGWVNGKVQKSFAVGTGQFFNFPIGDSTTYRPVTLTNMTVTTAGSLTVNCSGANLIHPQLDWSDVNQEKDVMQWWTLVPEGLTASLYSAAFTFASTDIDGGADPARFFVRRWDGSQWQDTTLGVRKTTSTQATGLSAFGDFVIGQIQESLGILITLPGQTFIQRLGNTGIASNHYVGAAFPITLTAVTTLTNQDLHYSGLKTITYSGPGLSPNGSAPVYTTAVTFTNGQARLLSTRLTKAETTTITATDGTLPGIASEPLTVVSGDPSLLAFISPPFTVTAGSPQGGLTVERQDAFGNPVTTNQAITLTLSSTSTGTATFTPNPVQILQGSSQAIFTYQDDTVGTPWLRAQSTGLSEATQQIEVTPVRSPAGTLFSFF